MSWGKLSKSKHKGGMGFRGFSDFNKALLGKHCWRLSTDPDSLLSKVLKSRYYPRCSFIDAPIGYQPSYAWRSILSAREVLEKGTIRSIGNGRTTKIWKDTWLPDFTKIRSRNADCDLSEDAMVAELIDDETSQWNRTLIFNSFSNSDAIKIVSTPLSLSLPEDKSCWFWEKDGMYSVRSAYHLLCNGRENSQPGPSSSRDDRLWKEIWKAPVPNKIKNFMWRLAKNILPTRGNLLKKGITLDTSCPLCHNSEENVQHLFMQCNIMKLALFASPLGCQPPLNTDLNCWLLEWLTCSDKFGAQLFCTTLWKFWFYRNQVVFNDRVIDPVMLAQASVHAVHEYNDANKQDNVVQVCSRERNSSHIPPLLFSMNIDAGCFDNAQTGWGLVLKDNTGTVIFSACRREQIEVSPILAEALGLRWAIQTAISQGIQSISFVCDALGVVNCVNGKCTVAVIDHVIQDCRNLLKSIPFVMVSHVSRELNREAHVLASMAKSVGCRSWLGNAPSNLNSFFVPAMLVGQVQAICFNQ
jgi:ribonuclease HI